jgi:prophage regulatory protein
MRVMIVQNTATRLLRYPDLVARGIVNNRTTLFRWIAAGIFPRPMKIGPASNAWRERDIDEWIERRAREAEGRDQS